MSTGSILMLIICAWYYYCYLSSLHTRESDCHFFSPWNRAWSIVDAQEIFVKLMNKWASLAAQTVKNMRAVQETQVQSLVLEGPWRKEWLPTPVFLPGESHGRRSLVGLSPWGCKQLDTTERPPQASQASQASVRKRRR